MTSKITFAVLLKLLAGLLVFQASRLNAQAPNTDIFLFEIKKSQTGISIEKGSNITNRDGYDNQPYFMPDNEHLLYASIPGDNQADLYRYSIKTLKTERLTESKQSEYSPQLTPDAKHISVVMVEKDSTQRIWQYNLNGHNESLLISQQDSIGYYSWLNTDSILFFKTTEPAQLYLYTISLTKAVWLADNITRSFKPINASSFFYVVKENGKNQVRVYDMKIRKSTLFAEAQSSNDDFVWDAELGLIKSEGSKLYRYNATAKNWIELVDFSGSGLKKISRFAFSKNGKYLAVVNAIE